MNSEQIKNMIETDPDYIASKRYGYSLAALLERYPDGCPDRIIATVLQMTEEEVEYAYQSIVKKLRRLMKVDSL
jgi:hypothetical protein